MTTFWDVFSIDIATAIVAIVALIVWLFVKRRRELYRELIEVFTMHSSLTTPEVLTAMRNGRSDAVSRDFLVALHIRTAERFIKFDQVHKLRAKNEKNKKNEKNEKNATNAEKAGRDDVSELVPNQLRAIYKMFPNELRDSQRKVDDKMSTLHEKNPQVQAQVAELARILDQGYPDVITSAKQSRAGAEQSMILTLRNGAEIYLAGNKHEVLPSGFEHVKRKHCQLNSVKVKRPLQAHDGNMKHLAEGVVQTLRDLRGQTCSCGAPFP